MSTEEKANLLTNENIVNANNLLMLKNELKDGVKYDQLSVESMQQLYQHYGI